MNNCFVVSVVQNGVKTINYGQKQWRFMIVALHLQKTGSVLDTCVNSTVTVVALLCCCCRRRRHHGGRDGRWHPSRNTDCLTHRASAHQAWAGEDCNTHAEPNPDPDADPCPGPGPHHHHHYLLHHPAHPHPAHTPPEPAFASAAAGDPSAAS